jgi:hypothetical protein
VNSARFKKFVIPTEASRRFSFAFAPANASAREVEGPWLDSKRSRGR